MILKSRLVKYLLRYVALRQILNLQEYIKMRPPPNFMFSQSSLITPCHGMEYSITKGEKTEILHSPRSTPSHFFAIFYDFFQLFLVPLKVAFEWSKQWRTKVFKNILHDSFHNLIFNFVS